jgi:mRNA interferase RelE/StbE
MKRQLTATALKSYQTAPPAVQKAFDKQVKLLLENLQHPSLRAKKYDEAKDIWRARVNRDWRFYFMIASDTYVIRDIILHPK